MTQALLQIENLTVRRNSTDILRSVSLRVDSGEYVSVIGPNGAGKSTLLKAIVGIIRDWHGQMSILGKAHSDFSHKDLARHVAYVPQTLNLSTEVSVFDFVLMGRFAFSGLMGFVDQADYEAVRRSLVQVESEQLSSRSILSLSGGERQRVVIAAALAQAPKLLLLDEPATFLDPRHQIDIYRLLRKCHKESGLAIFSVSHDVNSALASSDRVVALKMGKVEFESSSKMPIECALLESLYDTKFQEIARPQGGQGFFVPVQSYD